MKKLILIIAIVFSGMLMQAQHKKATTIVIPNADIESVMDYFSKHNVHFYEKVDPERRVAKSDLFPVNTRSGSYQGTITLKERNGDVQITGWLVNNTAMNAVTFNAYTVNVQMINKKGFVGGHLGGMMFRHVRSLAFGYQKGGNLAYY